MKRLKMPEKDGAEYPCSELVQVPAPLFSDYCRKPAIQCWLDEDEQRREFRCEEHKL